MSRRFSLPRLLPVTIVVMAALFGMKSVALVRAAVPPASGAPASGAPANGARANGAPAVAADASLAVIPACPPSPGSSPAERQLLLDLRKRSADLRARAAALDLRETVLKAAEKRLAQRVDELGALQKKLASEAAAREQNDAAKWKGLAQLYEAMQPRNAAAIFDGLPMPVLLGLMRNMNERKAAAILASMQPDQARALTARLAAPPRGGSASGS